MENVIFVSKEILSSLKKEEVLFCGKTWMNVETIVLSKIMKTDSDKVPLIGSH